MKSFVAMILEMPAPAIIFWGDDLIQLYNDGYAVIMGPRHPRYLGATYRECWPDTYPVIHPWMRKVLETGEIKQVEKTFFLLTRYGFNEEAYFTFDFSPLRDDEGRIAGILQVVFEVTDVVLSERRLATLRALAPRVEATENPTPDAIRALADNVKDIPFALIYHYDRATQRLALTGTSGLDGLSRDSAPVDLERITEAARQAMASDTPVMLEPVQTLLGGRHFGFWPEPTEAALALPLRRSSTDTLRGVVVLGISPRLRFDATYRQFFEDLARELATHLTVEQEKRAERVAFHRAQEARAQAEAEVARRAQAEAALRTSEERLRMALAAGQLGVVELQYTRGELTWDERALQHVGLPAGASPTLQEAAARIHPDDLERARRTVERALHPGAGATRLECRVQGWDGVERSLLAMVKTHFDAQGQPDRVVGALQDVTDQRSAERERERLATIVEQSTDFIGVGTEQGQALWVNEAGRRLLGIGRTEDVTQYMLADFFLPEDREYVAQHIAPQLLNGGRWEGEFRFRHFPTDTPIPAHYNTFALTDPNTRRQVGIATVSRDIRGQKQLEAEREALLTRERAAREEAEEANRLKDEFLATVSHELRTPLTAVLGWVQMLRTGTLPQEKRERALATVERNARAQGQLIEDLLDVSRIMTGKLKLEVTSVDVSQVVEAALESMKPAAEAKGIRIQAALDSGGSIMGDTSRLQQVVWNLLSNAVKFTPKGGRVQVLVERRNSSVEITVADTGQGISAQFLPHVFERFRQADGSTTRKTGGLGLGLSIVRHLVELHGGTVSVASDGDGQGATFVVSLPQAVALRREVLVPPALRAPLMEQDIPCPPQLVGLRLLVVDDEEDTRELLRSIIETCGGVVTTASSAEEALGEMQRQPFDVLVSDVGMPLEDGYRFIARVRALPPEQGGALPAVALTAYTRMEDRTRALLAGFTTHVPKPIEPVELMAVIASMANRRPPPKP
ncbi:ATP-binding protein [Comamonas sp. JC664]|uniref:ATP-binding protein n=1 Tax=Comamonas sp. JC664 TaxID=2801917 RepID=UPI00191E9795|nr:ATP-binding protein [Comamonas sp. JC664]MBL0693579.1 response regulator [Comamonas sp. JC664]